MSRTNDWPTLNELFRHAPVRFVLVAIAFVNWFAFAAVHVSIGGDAIGTTPSQQGFIVISHSRVTVVTQGVWLFSLCYGLATLTLTPLFFLLFAASQLYRLKGQNRYLVVIVALVCATG